MWLLNSFKNVMFWNVFYFIKEYILLEEDYMYVKDIMVIEIVLLLNENLGIG